jgi:hypothetical protein
MPRRERNVIFNTDKLEEMPGWRVLEDDDFNERQAKDIMRLLTAEFRDERWMLTAWHLRVVKGYSLDEIVAHFQENDIRKGLKAIRKAVKKVGIRAKEMEKIVG